MKCPFKFGLKGGAKKGPWDSAYCETGVLEDARRRFLTGAAGVWITTSTKLAVTDDRRSVCDHVADSPIGGIAYAGRWIADVRTVRSDPT